jgi:hypothetical protein
MSGAYFVCGLNLVFLTTHLPTYLAICGQDPMLSAEALAVIGGMNCVGSLLAGWLGGRYPRHILLGLLYRVVAGARSRNRVDPGPRMGCPRENTAIGRRLAPPRIHGAIRPTLGAARKGRDYEPLRAAVIAGLASRNGVAFSKASVTRNKVASANGLPASWIATGSPSLPNPAQTEIAG